MIWYTCQNCPPHSMSDHTLYGDHRCLIDKCPCTGFKADPSKPIEKKRPQGGPIYPLSKLYLR